MQCIYVLERDLAAPMAWMDTLSKNASDFEQFIRFELTITDSSMAPSKLELKKVSKVGRAYIYLPDNFYLITNEIGFSFKLLQ